VPLLAILWGSVAASFTIEQDGLPVLSAMKSREWWNGDDVMERVMSLRDRTLR